MGGLLACLQAGLHEFVGRDATHSTCLPATWRSVQTAKRKYRHTLEAMNNGTLGQEKGEEGVVGRPACLA